MDAIEKLLGALLDGYISELQQGRDTLVSALKALERKMEDENYFVRREKYEFLLKNYEQVQEMYIEELESKEELVDKIKDALGKFVCPECGRYVSLKELLKIIK